MQKSTESRKSSLQSYVVAFEKNSLDSLKILYPFKEVIVIFENYKEDPNFERLINAGILLLIDHLDLGSNLSGWIEELLSAKLMTDSLKRILYHYCLAEVSENPKLATFMNFLKKSIIRDLLAQNKRQSIELLDNKTLKDFLDNYKNAIETFKTSLLEYKKSWKLKSANELKALEDFLRVDSKSEKAINEYLAVLKTHETNIKYGEKHIFVDLRTYAEQLVNDYDEDIKPNRDSLFHGCITNLTYFIPYIAYEEFCSLLEPKQFQELCNKYEQTYRDVMNAFYPNHTCAKLRSESEVAKDPSIIAANNSSQKSSNLSSSSTDHAVTQNALMSTPRPKSTSSMVLITPPANNSVPLFRKFSNFWLAPFIKADDEPSLELIDIMAGMNILQFMNKKKGEIYLMTPRGWVLDKSLKSLKLADIQTFADELRKNKSKICFCIVNIEEMHWISLAFYLGDATLQVFEIDPSQKGSANRLLRIQKLRGIFEKMSKHLNVQLEFIAIPITQQDYPNECGYCCLETGIDVVTKDTFMIKDGVMGFDRSKLRLSMEDSSVSLQYDLIEVKKFWREALGTLPRISLDINDPTQGDVEYEFQEIKTRIDRQFSLVCKDEINNFIKDQIQVPRLEGQCAKIIDSFLLKTESQELLKKHGLSVETHNGKVGIRDRLHILVVNKHKELLCKRFNSEFIQHLKNQSSTCELSATYQTDDLRKTYDAFIKTSGLSHFVKGVPEHFPMVEKAILEARLAQNAVVVSPKEASEKSEATTTSSILLKTDNDVVNMDATNGDNQDDLKKAENSPRH